MVRALMGLMKDRHGTWYARVKVPERLQGAVARVLDQGKQRQSFLKKSLGTKELKAANVSTNPVLAGFDRVMRDATAIVSREAVPPANHTSLNAAEIARMSEALYGRIVQQARITFEPRFSKRYRNVRPRLDGRRPCG